MRAISPPTALPVAAAALALVAAVLAPLAVPSTALAERWLRPVRGELARPFSYSSDAPFVKGAHRGVDLAAPPGAAVHAACSGRVVHAGAVTGRHAVVSIRCGMRRVSHLPLAAVTVREGAMIRAGTPIGSVAPGHGGLHVGVRREGDPFGYEDPMALLPDAERPFTPAPRPAARHPTARPAAPRPAAPRPATRPAAPRPARPAAPRPAARPAAPPRPASRPAAPVPATPPSAPAQPIPRAAAWPATSPGALAGRAPASIAPWPVWVGLGALLAGAAGTGAFAMRRRRVAEARAAPAAATR